MMRVAPMAVFSAYLGNHLLKDEFILSNTLFVFRINKTDAFKSSNPRFVLVLDKSPEYPHEPSQQQLPFTNYQ